MEISGHKTRSCFDRYHIVSLADIQERGQKMDQWMKAQREVKRLSEAARLHAPPHGLGTRCLAQSAVGRFIPHLAIESLQLRRASSAANRRSELRF